MSLMYSEKIIKLTDTLLTTHIIIKAQDGKVKLSGTSTLEFPPKL